VFRKVAVSPAVVLASRPHLTYGKESGMFQKYRLRSTRGSTQGLLAQTRGASSTGAVAVGAGGELTAGAKTGDFEAVTRVAAEMVASVKAARTMKK
jgi:hypothetical protein